MTTINPDKLARLDQIELGLGTHKNFDDGTCAMEVVSWLADEGFTDAPKCASPIIRNYTIGLNDRWDDAQRQQLKPYLVRMIGTGSDGKDVARRAILRREVIALAPPWLRLVGLHEVANRTYVAKTDDELLEAIITASSQVRDKRLMERHKILECVDLELQKCDITDSRAVSDAIITAAARAITSTTVITATADAAILAIRNTAANSTTDISGNGVSATAVDAEYATATLIGAYIKVFSKEWWATREAVYRAAMCAALRLHRDDVTFEYLRKLRDEQDDDALHILDKIITADA